MYPARWPVQYSGKDAIGKTWTHLNVSNVYFRILTGLGICHQAELRLLSGHPEVVDAWSGFRDFVVLPHRELQHPAE